MADTDPECHINPTISNEQFVADHIFFVLQKGGMTFYDVNRRHTIQPGDFRFIRRNQLARYTKTFSPDNTFESISVFFKQDFLRSISQEYNLIAGSAATKDTTIIIEPDTLLKNFVQSYGPYTALSGPDAGTLIALKQRELIFILLRINPGLKNILFDFSDPEKIDLEAFMTRNFRFNASLQRFSYLTGRSLTTFKRDFEKAFNMPPGRWLIERRLKEAHYLIQTKGVQPSLAYLEVGFEDLSHFSFAFKKMFGVSPAHVKKVLPGQAAISS